MDSQISRHYPPRASHSGPGPGGRVRNASLAAKKETGLDHRQVRRYGALYRHLTLFMLAPAFPMGHRRSKGAPPVKPSRLVQLHDREYDLIRLSASEIYSVLAHLSLRVSSSGLAPVVVMKCGPGADRAVRDH
jgi:hypothetical protein